MFMMTIRSCQMYQSWYIDKHAQAQNVLKRNFRNLNDDDTAESIFEEMACGGPTFYTTQNPPSKMESGSIIILFAAMKHFICPERRRLEGR